MRYVKIFSDMWISDDFKDLSSDEKVLFLYLLSCDHCNAIGFYRLPIGYINADTGVSAKLIENALESLENRSMISYDKQTSMVLIKKYLKWNILENNNQIVSAVKLFEQLKRTSLDDYFLDVAEQFCPAIIEQSDIAKTIISSKTDPSNSVEKETVSKGYQRV